MRSFHHRMEYSGWCRNISILRQSIRLKQLEQNVLTDFMIILIGAILQGHAQFLSSLIYSSRFSNISILRKNLPLWQLELTVLSDMLIFLISPPPSTRPCAVFIKVWGNNVDLGAFRYFKIQTLSRLFYQWWDIQVELGISLYLEKPYICESWSILCYPTW